MAEEQQDLNENQNRNGVNGEISGDSALSLENFITRQYDEQQRAGKHDDGIDDERAANFFARALGESQRMSKQVEKSHSKLDELHGELGAEIFSQWRQEHAAEVLTPEELDSVNRTVHGSVAPPGATLKDDDVGDAR